MPDLNKHSCITDDSTFCKPECKGVTSDFSKICRILHKVVAIHSTRNAGYNSFTSVDNHDFKSQLQGFCALP